MKPIEAVPLGASRRLRYVLTVALLEAHRPHTLAELVERAELHQCRMSGRPGKVVSDALRWEVRKGRVVQTGRGLYRIGSMPRSTEWWIRACLREDDRWWARARSDRGTMAS
jgi:hypothetical protein